MSLPKLSLGVPVYNGEPYLAKALDNLLGQDYQDFEIVISDNGSRDRTPQICQEYLARDARIRYVRHEHTVPPVGNFCRTLAAARGEYFTWTAVDDERPPGAISACVAALDENPAAVMAHGPVIADLVKQGTRVTIEHRMNLMATDVATRVQTYAEQVQYNGMLYAVYRREALQNATFKQHPGHDYLLPLQLCAQGRVAYTTTPMLVYRHVWGETDTPMYRLEPITVRDLFVYRGIRRRKCWITLVYGAYFLLTLRGVALRDRVRAAAAHMTTFARRFRRHLLTEAVFLMFTPAMWAFGPLVVPGRRLKYALLRRGTVA
jgi:glycosyltransferase involved in cell wall biosynthesis